MTLNIEIAIEQTDYAWFDVRTQDYALWCGRIDYYGPDGPVPEKSFVEAIREHRVPDCRGESTLDGLPLADVDATRPLSELSGRRKDASRTLLGFRDIDGQLLDAHDMLGRIIDVSFSRFKSSNCTNVASNAIKSVIRGSFKKGLPLGLRDAVLAPASIDPVLAFNDREDLLRAGNGETGVFDEHRRCVRDVVNDFCHFRTGGPAYRAEDGSWRGARHRCRERDAKRAATLGGDAQAAVGLASIFGGKGDFCHVQLEPDRLNVRPEGIEIVFVDFADRDTQWDFYQHALRDPLCRERDGAPLDPETDPRHMADPTPFVVEP